MLFPPETLDRPEDPADVVGFLQPWVRALIVRHPDMKKIEQLAAASEVPVINAMTDINHPCEILSDLYSLQRDYDIERLRFVYVGARSNTLHSWQEASRALGLDLTQCCPSGLEVPGIQWKEDIHEAVRDADVIMTDRSESQDPRLARYQITEQLLDEAPAGALFDPCPPFTRGAEISAGSLDHSAFVGHRFKSALLPVQQAITAFCLGADRQDRIENLT
ncbi:hypothetical protein [Bifidobacterium fermentum]|uniref:hypothetical protein n=2 Tax=Bifidobacterium TaxID=1678 RepID=UPI0034E20813